MGYALLIVSFFTFLSVIGSLFYFNKLNKPESLE